MRVAEEAGAMLEFLYFDVCGIVDKLTLSINRKGFCLKEEVCHYIFLFCLERIWKSREQILV